MTDARLAPLTPEAPLLAHLVRQADLSAADRAAIVAKGADLVRAIRASARPGLMEVFLAEYGLSTDEGIALMCLAEALLRVPDAPTIDALIEDKIAPSDWGQHLGHSASVLVNASTWALMLTGKVLEPDAPGLAGALRGAVKRLGEPVIRTAVARAMREMGRQFVLGEDIAAAMTRARTLEARGYSYSYDMLGEAARTGADAARYAASYAAAIAAIAQACKPGPACDNPGISVKLSALHPRYEEAQRGRVMAELVPVLRDLARAAAAANMGFNIDAEEQDRLVLSLDVIEAVLSDPALAGWDGFGLVVQAYGPRAGAVIDGYADLAERLQRHVALRLVKGAYWDSEIKRAQVLGLDGFPVLTSKPATDVSYLAQARKLMGLPRIYPQFATHNAHTVAAVLHMAREAGRSDFEFQRLHGMGERLHDIVRTDHATRCRIYAPVGAHRDLLAYLVRRLLENGANSSFVNQIVDESVPPETVAACPLDALARPARRIATGAELFPDRRNARGFDVTARPDLAAIEAARAPWRDTLFTAAPRIAGTPASPRPARPVLNPATGAHTGSVAEASDADIAAALDAARVWDAPPATRAQVLERAADLFEANHGALFALLAREAGKTLPDAISELREAVDFLRYYATRITPDMTPRGTIAAISPWNFPLAIFTGQIAGALAAGNAVLAKPAEQTPLVAARAVELLHQAGVPATALQLLPGDGRVGAALTRAPLQGVVFTGSTETARTIRRTMADTMDPGTPLIAETGGLNAMIVDSTALAEQAVRDIIASAFQSAGQRCSALRVLYVQDESAGHLLEMLLGAMRELRLGDPWDITTDIGPVIDAQARAGIDEYLSQRTVLAALPVPPEGCFAAPSVLRVDAIADLPREIFGPVLHVATFPAGKFGAVLEQINARGYGLTLGLHTRIDARVEDIAARAKIGNLYVNRNQIGAVVGSQPFGGEGLSGTGPKAGGPDYVARLAAPRAAPKVAQDTAPADMEALARRLAGAQGDFRATHDLPGPTGESNRLTLTPRAPVLCLGPGPVAEAMQAGAVQALGGVAVMAGGAVAPGALADLPVSGVIWWGDAARGRGIDRALAAREGVLVPLITALPDRAHVLHERHLCIDTTAAGGNAQLLAGG